MSNNFFKLYKGADCIVESYLNFKINYATKKQRVRLYHNLEKS